MKALIAVLFVLVGAQAAPALAGPSEGSPLIGRWAVDVSRLPLPPEARPKRVTIAFDDTDDGKWTTRVDIVDAAGVESHAVSTAALDGSATRVEGSSEADTAALRMPVPDVLVMALGKGGVAASTRIYAVAADGGSLVETAVYFADNGVPVMRTNHFTRMRQR